MLVAAGCWLIATKERLPGSYVGRPGYGLWGACASCKSKQAV
jgi:hypothetical protein